MRTGSRSVLLFMLAAWACACAREGGSATKPAAIAEPECTLETPLVPGVPGSPGHLLPSDINPNGASELAALMRTMTADLEQLRTTLDTASPIALHARHRKIRCAWPTDPGERTPEYDAFAQLYLARVQALDASAPADRKVAYDAVVTACTSCHQQTCSGPIPRIQKLRL